MSLPNYTPKTMAPTESVQRQIDQLSQQLSTLRLPHKLNQYRVYEKQLRLLRQSTSNQSEIENVLDQLQTKLDKSVICGVTQCFICGPESNNQPSGSVQPAYLRSSSASSTIKTQPKEINGYAKQISLVESRPVPQNIPTSQSSPPPSNFHLEPRDKKLKTEILNHQSEESKKETQPEPMIEKPTSTAPTITLNSTVKETNEPLTETLATSSSNDSVTQNGTKPKPNAKPIPVAKSPITSPSKTPINSYRAYKDFINNYSANKSKASIGSNSTP